MPLVTYITHPEVVIDPAVPVPRWPLSEVGRARMAALAELPELRGTCSVWSSSEQKARDGAQILAERFGLEPTAHAGLDENDRSATGFLPPDAFWPVVEAFFAEPDQSTHGWETARAAQARVARALDEILAQAPDGDIAIIGHGGTGTLLCQHLTHQPIRRDPEVTMGARFQIDRASRALTLPWTKPPEL